ncbi:putative GABA-specific permease [Oryza sativa Japonica Group]|uniref:GABA-specific permease n=1 Tax=Oryza sativa subsp. japonica TaxID=39947 RepID=Q5JKI7_ORYSJ|nr:putative GABA-specific permease [Oryza sativa Japonica Group]
MSRSGVVAMDAAGADADQARLHQLGYRQELKRGLSYVLLLPFFYHTSLRSFFTKLSFLVSNFAFSFSIISVLTGVTTTYGTGLRYGGPVSMTLGWLVVSAFNGCVALSMAEICSAYPTSGGLYYWSAKLAGKEWAPLASWVTGWFNIVGQLLQVIILLATGGANGGGYMASKYVVLAIYSVILILHGLINSLPIHWLSWFGQLGAFWNVAGVFALTILIPSVAKERASPEFIFTHFNTENGMGIHQKAYILAVGLLMSQYSVIGYDTSAHMIEETKNADWSGPMGIITSVGLSTMFGWIYLIALTSIMTDIPYLLNPSNDAGGYAIAQALYTSFHRRYGTGAGALACLGVIAVAIFLCGSACITSNSRMGYAFSRDGAMPLSRVWHRVDSREVPLNVVWLSVAVAFVMALTVNSKSIAAAAAVNFSSCSDLVVFSWQSLGSQVAFQAMVSVTTLGLYIAYALPVFFRVTTARKSFVPGQFHLGRYGLMVGWMAVVWVATVTVLFSLPVAYPVAKETFNYTPVAVGGVLLLSLVAWVFHARFWFQGPVTNVDA